jgi:hypothetical protein
VDGVARLGEAEISDGEGVVCIVDVEQVLWLEVAMHDAPSVHMGACTQEASQDGGDFAFGVWPPGAEAPYYPVHELSPCGVLQHNNVRVEIVWIAKMAFELYDILVLHHLQRCNLLSNPLLKFFRCPLRFLSQYFQSLL